MKEGGGRGLESGKRRLVASSRQSAPDSRSVRTYVTRVRRLRVFPYPLSAFSRFVFLLFRLCAPPSRYFLAGVSLPVSGVNAEPPV